jgi:hypothetical protein
VLGDFFPLLPAGALLIGASEETDPGRTIRRMADQPGSGGAIARYGWTVKVRADTSGSMADTLVVPMRREGEEVGTLAWDRRRGPLGWERTISVTGKIVPSGAVRRGLTSTVTQRIKVTRLSGRACG